MGFGEMVDHRGEAARARRQGWELYHVDEDFAETKNLAAEHRDKLIEMIALWYVEAGKYNVLPIDSRGTARLVDERPQLAADRATATSTTRARRRSRTRSRRACSTGRTASPRRSRSPNGAEGVLVAQGGSSGGYTLYVKDHKLHYAYNYLGVQQFHARDRRDGRRRPARAALRVRADRQARPRPRQGDAGARAALHRRQAGRPGRPAGHHPARHRHHRGADCGRDDGSAVTTDYQAPFAFTGELEKVVVDVSGELIEDKDAEMRSVMAHQ